MTNNEPFAISKTVIDALTDIDLLSLDLHYSAKSDEAYETLKKKIELLQEKISKLCLYSEYIGNACIKLEADKPIGNGRKRQTKEPTTEVSLV